MKAKIKAVIKVIVFLIVAGLYLKFSSIIAAAEFTIPVPSAPGTAVQRNSKAIIDYSNAKDGYVQVKYMLDTTTQLRVIIKTPTGVSYSYHIKPGNFEVFPLSESNGSYSIGVYEQVEGTRFAIANTATINVKLVNEFMPFLTPNQYVNFNKDSLTVKQAIELVSGTAGLLDKIAAVYNYIINNFTYDKELASTVQSGYLPDVDAVLRRRRGICFDYAAVMTAMLRSQGIPCQLVVGYAGEIYHAWINVYSKETGWINKVIFFDGKNWKLMDPTFASSASQSSEIMKFIGDGTNYRVRFRY